MYDNTTRIILEKIYHKVLTMSYTRPIYICKEFKAYERNEFIECFLEKKYGSMCLDISHWHRYGLYAVTTGFRDNSEATMRSVCLSDRILFEGKELRLEVLRELIAMF